MTRAHIRFWRYRLANIVVEVQAAGFKSYEQVGIKLDANDALRLDISLQIGQPSQTVEVSANAVHVDTISTASGDVISDKKMEALPLNGRSYTNLLGLQPGVVPVTASTLPGQGNYAATAATGNLSISGNRESANGFVVNGGNVEEDRNNGAAIVPNLDSIAEFRLLTNAYDAEYGYFSGGMVNVVTKSGTNNWHGNVFEFLRNTSLDARNYYDVERGVFRQNQFGGTLGGPVFKNKLFFFVDYQGTRQTQGLSSGLIPVPSSAERGGDFSSIISAPGFTSGTVTGPYLRERSNATTGIHGKCERTILRECWKCLHLHHSVRVSQRICSAGQSRHGRRRNAAIYSECRARWVLHRLEQPAGNG